MTDALAEALADLTEDLDTTVLTPALGAEVWARGRRRRRRTQAARVAVAALVVTAVGVALLPGSWAPEVSPAGPGATSPLGHPERIATPWHVGELPRRGDPLAGIAYRGNDIGSGRWYAVTQDGGLRNLPVTSDLQNAVVPSLSADGRVLGYVDRASNQYVLRDVVTGASTTFPRVRSHEAVYGAADNPPDAPSTVGSQTPGYFSPDGRRVAVSGGVPGGPGGRSAVLVLGTDGSVRPVAVGQERSLVGWLDDDTLLTMGATFTGSDPDVRTTLTPIATTLDGRERRLPSLSPDQVLGLGDYSQWSPALSPDRRTLAIGLGPVDSGSSTASGGDRVLSFALATGEQVDGGWPDVSPVPGAQVASDIGMRHVEWAGGQWYGLRGDTALTGLWSGGPPSRAALVIDPGLELGWLDLADQALAGPTHHGLLGTRQGWASWHWRELLLIAAAVAGGLFLRAVSRRERVADRSGAA